MQLYNIIQADFIGLSFEDKISYLSKFTKKALKALDEDIVEFYGHNFTKDDLIKNIISLYPDKDLIKHFKTK